MRPRQWAKNGFVFAAILFDGQATDMSALARTLAAFILMSLLSGSVYILNDLADIESDRQHPTKRNRPLAAGKIKSGTAVAFAILLIAVVGLLSYLLSPQLAIIFLTYLLLQVAYNLKLKHVVLIDVGIVALGFILRVAAGVSVIEVERFSPWLYVCAGLLALFIALGKRRQELIVLGAAAGNHRLILDEYNLELIDRLIGIITSSVIVAYSLYTFLAPGLPENNSMMFTIPFVLYGMGRWLYLIHVRGEGGAPEEVLLTDRSLQVALSLWVISAGAVIYFFG